MIFTIYDIETNGLIKDKKLPLVLEVGYIQINRKLEILRGDTFYFYRPEWELDTGALAVNGLTREFLEKHQDEYYGSMVRLWTLMNHGNLIGKNNVSFDTPCCRNMFSVDKALGSLPIVNYEIDMQKVYAPVFRKVMSDKTGTKCTRPGRLEEYMDIIGISQDEIKKQFNELFTTERDVAHCALYDAFMTYLVVKDSVKRNILKLEE